MNLFKHYIWVNVLFQIIQINFTKGYRRCPGELLTYTLLEEFIYIVNQNKSKIKIELNKSIKKHFMFGIIETNYYFL